MAAEASSAAIILTSSAAGMALSTTQVATGSILGSGLGKRGAQVRWSVAGRMAVAWVTTLPAAGAVGAAAFYIAHLLGNVAGAVTIFVMLIVASAYMYWRAQQNKIDATNVTEEWEDGNDPADMTLPAEIIVVDPHADDAATSHGPSSAA